MQALEQAQATVEYHASAATMMDNAASSQIKLDGERLYLSPARGSTLRGSALRGVKGVWLFLNSSEFLCSFLNFDEKLCSFSEKTNLCSEKASQGPRKPDPCKPDPRPGPIETRAEKKSRRHSSWTRSQPRRERFRRPRRSKTFAPNTGSRVCVFDVKPTHRGASSAGPRRGGHVGKQHVVTVVTQRDHQHGPTRRARR